jgi:hypothetical protein
MKFFRILTNVLSAKFHHKNSKVIIQVFLLCGQASNNNVTLFWAIGFFNEADTLESSSILIYPQSMTGLGRQDAT